MVRVIDAHHHWMPQEHLDETERYLAPNESVQRDGRYVRIFRDGVQMFTIDADRYPNVPAQLRDMDAAGVDCAVLSTGLWQEWNSMEMAPFINDRLAEIQKSYPGRIIGLAHVPPFAPEAPRELERAARELGLRGICLNTHCQDRYLDSRDYAPVYRKAEELELPIFIHATTVPPEHKILDDYDLVRPVGRAYEHTVSTTKLLCSGILEEFPRLRIVMGHLGGAFFVLKGRFMEGGRGVFTIPSVPFARYLEQVYFDTAPADWSKAELECAASTLGTDHIVFGTDYPVITNWLEKGMTAMHETSLPQDQKNGILGGNLAELLKIA